MCLWDTNPEPWAWDGKNMKNKQTNKNIESKLNRFDGFLSFK